MNRGRRVPLSLALTELRSNCPSSYDIFPGARRLVEVREHDDLVLASTPETNPTPKAEQ